MGIIFIIAILSYFVIYSTSQFNYQSQAQSQAQDILNQFQNINGQTYPLHMLQGIDIITIIFIISLLADIVTDEYKNGTIKLSLLRPVSRTKLLISKLVCLLFGLFFLYIFTMVISYVLGSFFWGFGDQFEFSGIRYTPLGEMVNYTCSFSSFEGILFTICSYLLSLIPYFIFGILVLFISLFFSSMGATICISLGVWLSMTLISQQIIQVRPYMLSSYFTFYLEFASNINIMQVILGFSIMFFYCIAFFLGGLLVFRKKDILL